MGLVFHHHIFTCQVWARGSILVPGLHLGCVFTIKASASIRPNPKFRAELAIIWGNEHFYEDFESLMSSLSLTLNVEP